MDMLTRNLIFAVAIAGFGPGAMSGEPKGNRGTGGRHLGGAGGRETLRGLRAAGQRRGRAGLLLPRVGRAVQPGVAGLPAAPSTRPSWRGSPIGACRGPVTVEMTSQRSFRTVAVRPSLARHPAHV